MSAKARRPLLRRLSATVRRALMAGCLWHAGAAAAGQIVEATYQGPTGRYPHGVLGDAIEHETLEIRLESGSVRRFTLPDQLVFEDTMPRLADLDGDGAPEALVVESDQSRGARLAVYGAEGRIAATPFIGTRFRWLAPLGAADLDGDGRIDIAYVDRPHLAKRLRLWRYQNGALVHLADFDGVTNHRIGEEDIAGGIRDCGQGPEMILADAAWQSLLAVRFDGRHFSPRRIGIDTSRSAFAAAMGCELR